MCIHIRTIQSPPCSAHIINCQITTNCIIISIHRTMCTIQVIRTGCCRRTSHIQGDVFLSYSILYSFQSWTACYTCICPHVKQYVVFNNSTILCHYQTASHIGMINIYRNTTIQVNRTIYRCTYTGRTLSLLPIYINVNRSLYLHAVRRTTHSILNSGKRTIHRCIPFHIYCKSCSCRLFHYHCTTGDTIQTSHDISAGNLHCNRLIDSFAGSHIGPAHCLNHTNATL